MSIAVGAASFDDSALDPGLGADAVFEGEVFRDGGHDDREGGDLDLNSTMLATMLPDLDSSLVAELVRSGSVADESTGGVWERPSAAPRPPPFPPRGGTPGNDPAPPLA